VVASAADGRSDSERNQPASYVRALGNRKPLEERLLDAIGDLAHRRSWQIPGDQFTPKGVARGPGARDLARELANEVGASASQHHCHHKSACPIRVVEHNPVDFSDRLGEQRARFEESGGFNPRQSKRSARSDSGDRCASAHEGTTCRHSGEVAAL
jgi:hypothetical protein